MAAQLKITERRAGDIAIIDLAGRLEIGDGDVRFAARLDELVRAGQRHILVNMRDLVHIDSGGIGVLLSRHAYVRKHGGALKLVNLPESTHRTLVVTRLLSVLDTFCDESDAIASFSAT